MKKLALCSLFVLVVGCSSEGDDSSGGGGAGAGKSSGASPTTGSMSTTESGGSMSNGSNNGSSSTGFSGSSGTGEPPCAQQTATATLKKKPVDIIVVIDNSGSMTEEIVGVQNNINANFATIIEASGLDYRVILLADHGKATVGQSICIEAPLSGIPAGGCTNPPTQPVNNPPKFFHYSEEIASRNSWCKILETFDTVDEFNLAPTGWQEWLRPEAFKTFIEITDDGVGCTFNGKTYQDSNNVMTGTSTAAVFDADLLAKSPTAFGTAAERNYSFYSIVAMSANVPPTEPWPPTAPVTTGECPTAANPGTGHQALSVLTNSLRFPICDTTSYDAVFQAIAAGVISGAKIDCEFPVPDPPFGQSIDLKTVVVSYTPSTGGNAVDFTQVPNLAACAPNSFYIDNGTTIHLCDGTCDLVQDDDMAKIDIAFKCAGTVM